jgi:hypothetical protein
MNIQIPPIHEELLRRLNYYSLAAVLTDPSLQAMQLAFVSTVEQEEDISIKLHRPVLIKLSKLPEDEELFLVGKIQLRVLEHDKGLVLGKLEYGFDLIDGESLSYLPSLLYHLKLEGDICLDVVCIGYSISKQVK